MRTFVAAVILALFTAQACAQGAMSGGRPAKPGQKTDAELADEQRRRKIEDKAYNDALSRIPEKTPKQKNDPWATVR